jgi:dolichyl-phosphate-mannose--protein O-mannosyl transferase
MKVIGSLLTFYDNTCTVNSMFQKMFFDVFNLLYVIGDILLLSFWVLVIVVYTRYLIEDNCIKILFMN